MGCAVVVAEDVAGEELAVVPVPGLAVVDAEVAAVVDDDEELLPQAASRVVAAVTLRPISPSRRRASRRESNPSWKSRPTSPAR
jgi:hypothetical protein